MRLDIVEIGSANGLYFDVDPISTACRNRVHVEIESVYPSTSCCTAWGDGVHSHFLCYSHPVPLVQTYRNVYTFLGGYKGISGRLSLCFHPYHEDIDFSQILGRFRDLASHHLRMYVCWVVGSQDGFEGHLYLVYRCHSEMEQVLE